jgi:hypothetical protein
MISSQAEKMIEKVISGSNVIEEVSNRIRMETVSIHLAEKGCLVYPVRNSHLLLFSVGNIFRKIPAGINAPVEFLTG